MEYSVSRIESSVLWESHCHAEYEMIAVLKGDISIVLEGRAFRLTEGQTAIVPPLCYHTVKSNKNGEYRRVTALFDLEALPEVLRAGFVGKGEKIAIFYFSETELLAKICMSGERAYFEPLLNSLMVRIFYAAAESARIDYINEEDEFLNKIISYIDAHLGEKILLDDLAAHTARSKSSVCHLFTEKMNISPKQYILEKKLAAAMRLIRGGMPAALAAQQVGYENYSNFYRVYKDRFKTSPKDKSEAFGG